ncbi:YolD-like family protein [Bacillus thuringiensis]|uniref:YolD-like family protein n=1 Tax=Bacillus thuringiensis TaxID=1428 RepID=UPI000BFD2A52|nr:YolD-like family protein [Bacillus thuringiensis]PGQ63389.1 3-oxoacyl-ACP synthase [Bacillus thuringiensis]
MENQNWGAPKIKGRGMVKWQPFASMPEQFAGIREIMGELNKVPKPMLTQDTKERIERALINSAQRQEDILISFYRDGFMSNMYITVIRIDLHTNTVHCTDAFNLHTEFKFDEIVDVTE